MKKIIALTLAAVILISFAACSKVKEETEEMIPDKVEEKLPDLNDKDTVDKGNDGNLLDSDTPTTGTVEAPVEKNDATKEANAEETKEASEYSKYSDTRYGFGFTRSEKGVVPPIGFYLDMMKGKNAAYLGNTNEKTIYLTFDEGYENGYTASILDTLKEKNVTAAFFCTGDYVTRNKDLIGRMVNEGHIVGNHSWNHKSMPSLSETEFKEELKKIDDFMKENFGYTVTYLRYPNGEFSEKTLEMAKDLGYKTAFWSVAYKDWDTSVINGADYAVNQVLNHIHNGAIILLHAVSKDNTEALGTIIDKLREEGYTFASLNSLSF